MEENINRWLGELHHRMEALFKKQLSVLLESGEYQDGDLIDKEVQLES